MRNVIFLRLMCVSTESTWNYSMDLQGSPANYSAGLFSEGVVRLPAEQGERRMARPGGARRAGDGQAPAATG